jgi:hypothetical protein
VRSVAAARMALLVPKGINFFPDSNEKVPWLSIVIICCMNSVIHSSITNIITIISSLDHITHVKWAPCMGTTRNLLVAGGRVQKMLLLNCVKLTRC